MKHLLGKPHMIFSVENPKHDTGLKISHEEFLKKLQNAGIKAHHLGGHYGSPENSILIEDPDDNIKNSILNIAEKQGQESVLFSDGKNHELQYISGPEKGRVVRGSGTIFHTNKPEDFYRTLPSGEHFTHNLDFDKSAQKKQEQAPDQQELEPLKKPYASDAQRRWAHTKAGTKALGGEKKVREWDRESKGKDLPERVEKSKRKTYGSDLIPGGLADKKTNEDFPKKQLDMGRKVEMEHTNNPKIAEEIARDHLMEDKAYYDKLKTIEPKHKMEKRCWEGYKPVPGKKPYSKGSCTLIRKKESTEFMLKSWSKKRSDEIRRKERAKETIEQTKKRYGGFTNAIDAAIANVDKQFPKKEDKPKTEELNKSKNVREQKKLIFGTDPNAPRTSDKRIKMMNALRNYAQKKYGLNLEIAQGKRDASGQLREDRDNQPTFDIFSPDGVLKEKTLLEQYKKQGKKRNDPKPDWRSGKLESQPSPDAAVHEFAHLDLAPEGSTLPEFQDEMDRTWGESQRKYGHMQQKKTRGEVQPMSIENPIRREIGLPANRTARPVTENQNVLDDPGQKRFVEGKDYQGKTVFYDRQSRLQNPETRERRQQIQEGSLKFDPKKGWYKATDTNALINLRARGQHEEALRRIKERAGSYEKPTKLAASENLSKAPIEYEESEAHYLGESPLESPSKQRFNKYKHITSYNAGPGRFHHVYHNTFTDEIIHQLTDSESPWKAKNIYSDITGKPNKDGSLNIVAASVDPKHKGKGYGKALYAQVLAHHGKIYSDELVSRMADKAYTHLENVGARVKRGGWDTRERHEAIATPEMKQKIGFKEDDKLASSELQKVSSPKKGHTIDQLNRLKQDNWHNPDTGKEMSAEESERYLWQMRQNKADKKVKESLKAPKVSSGEKPEDWFGKSRLEKMSRPRITFPNLRQVSTRPDQKVQPIKTGRQKEILGKKITQTYFQDPKEQAKVSRLSPSQKEKVHAGGFSDKNFKGLISKLKQGHQKAYQTAQNIKEEDLLVPGQSVQKSISKSDILNLRKKRWGHEV